MRTCFTCGKDKSDEDFYRNNSGTFRRSCKRCEYEVKKVNQKKREPSNLYNHLLIHFGWKTM